MKCFLFFISNFVHKHKNLVKNLILIVFFLLLQSSCNYLRGQIEPIATAADQFMKLFPAGDFVGAERSLKLIIDSGYEIPAEYRIFFYNGLGATSTIFSRYNEALIYYDMAEKYVVSGSDTLFYLSTIYINKALVYGYLKSYDVAEEYFGRAIRITLKNKTRDKDFYTKLSTAYLNLGLFLFETSEYQKSLDYLKKSAEMKKKFSLSDLAMVYLSIATTYSKIDRYDDAQLHFKKCREILISENGQNYYRLPELYFEYGQFLQINRNCDEALELYLEALSICKKNYGEKHSFTSRSYQLIGDIYFSQNDFQRALEYYQNSLISITEGFYNHDIFSNPPIDSSIFNLRLLDNLKRKSSALEMLVLQQQQTPEKLKYLDAGLETLELAVALITKIRNSYLTDESRLWLSENEKKTYMAGVRLAHKIFSITGDIGMMEKMYMLAGDAKARLLRDEITRNDLFHSSAIPDSLWQKQKELESLISANKKQVTDESLKESPDTVKISRLKDAIFTMKRESEKFSGEIKAMFPINHQLLERTKPMPVDEIRKRMKNDETIIDYYLCSADSSGMRYLYIFLITSEHLTYHMVKLDSLFTGNAALIRDMNHDPGLQVEGFPQYTGALNYMNNVLIKPLEAEFNGKKLIIIPDEDISWLPFNAFLVSPPGPGQTDYESLDYLIKKYVISSAYSSSLVFNDNRKRGSRVDSFLPDYHGDNDSDFRSLKGAGEEISSVYRWFRGERFEGVRATETNFRRVLDGHSVIHMAMHSVPDTVTPEYSFLQFSAGGDSLHDGKLFNYEISLSRTRSPLVVISACNSGTGRLYQSEGLMSIARSFMLAGSSSVVKTSWKINDETSAQIMAGFYRYLSKGEPVNEALRNARLDYLKSSSPSFTCPYYWAAYEVLGGRSPVTVKIRLLIILTVTAVAVVLIFAVFYFRRRRISAARSL